MWGHHRLASATLLSAHFSIPPRLSYFALTGLSHSNPAETQGSALRAAPRAILFRPLRGLLLRFARRTVFGHIEMTRSRCVDTYGMTGRGTTGAYRRLRNRYKKIEFMS